MKYITALLCLFANALVAQNLVPNHSFENFNYCPQYINDYGAMQNWFRTNPTSYDIFAACADGQEQGAPHGYQGYQPAQDGGSYIGLVTKYFGQEYREYISIKLAQRLMANHTYCVSFYVCAAENQGVFADSFGAYLGDSTYTSWIGASGGPPQIKNPATNYIADSTNWVKIEGIYFAHGGEQYITIGNFAGNDSTLLDPAGLQLGNTTYAYCSYVLLDNVEVKLCDGVSGVNEQGFDNRISIYPNPANDYLVINAPQTYKSLTMQLYSLTGALVHKTTLNPAEKPKIDVSALANGTYIAQVMAGNNVLERKKILINR